MTLCFEDLKAGDRRRFGAWRVTEEEILQFALEFDPQPFHVDPSTPGGLMASGWHTCAMNMRMTYDGFLADSSGVGAPGVESVEWLKPVRPGMTLSIDLEVLGSRVMRSRPTLGLVSLVFTMVDETNGPVMRQRNWTMFGRRDPTAPFPADEAPAPPRKSEQSEPPAFHDPAINRTRFASFFEEAVVGARVDLGSHRFTRAEMLDFAAKFDPQPFHIDDSAAAASHFGALAASGWQTASTYMKKFVATRDRYRAEAIARGEKGPAGGPSPGVHDLRWTKPVFVGDEISYETAIIGKTPSSKPGWGKLQTRARGFNQNGEMVFETHGVARAPMRP